MKKPKKIRQEKKTKLFVQITLFILVTGSLSGMLIGTEVYSDVQNRIVEVLCLSCLKLDPKTTTDFTFDTVQDAAHPSYVLENLSSGIVFLHFSEDACPGCDIMYPVVKDLLGIDFGKEDLVSTHVTYKSANMTYFYTNIDHAPSFRSEAFFIYDIRNIRGLPMFTIVTLGYDKGIIRPILTSLYGTVGEGTFEKQYQVLADVVHDAMTLWNENIPGYNP